MKKNLKSFIVLILLVCLCVPGCGVVADEEKVDKTQSNVMLVRENLTVVESENMIEVHITGECLYGIKENMGKYYYVQIDFTEQEGKEVQVILPDKRAVLQNVFMGENGAPFYLFKSDTDFYIAKGNADGTVESTQKLQATEITEGMRHRDFQGYTAEGMQILLFDANIREKDLLLNREEKVVSTGDDTVFFNTSNLLFIDGSEIFETYQTVQTVQYEESMCIEGFLQQGEENFILTTKTNENKLVLQKLEGNNGMQNIMEQEIGEQDNCVLAKSTSADCIYFTDSKNLYKYQQGSTTAERIYELKEVGIDAAVLKEVYITEEGVAYFLMYDDVSGVYSCQKIGNEAVEKQVITLGLPYRFGIDPSSIYRVVNKYNQKSSKYYVQIEEFAESYLEFADKKDRIMIDIMNGKGTDILYIRGFGKEILGNAGMLVNLREFISEDVWNETYVGNILDSTLIGENLYSVGPFFTVYTVIANGEKAGYSTGWDMETMRNCLRQSEKDVHALYGFYADEPIIITLCYFALNDYIDWGEGTCDFENEEFYALLEFAKEKTTTTTDYGKHMTGVRNGQYLAEIALITSVHQYQEYNEIYGGKMQVKGFPTRSGTGVAAQIHDDLSIYSLSNNKEAAWDFIQFYLQESENAGAFPILRDRLEENFAEAMVDEYAEGEILPKVYYNDGENQFFIYHTTEQDVMAVRGIIDLVDRENRYNELIQNIIEEEVSAYYGDSVSVEETAARIQNRVSLYLEENKR